MAACSPQAHAAQVIVTGQRIAKATSGYPPRRRAQDAIRWIRGELAIVPTIKLAAETFGVSIRAVAQERARQVRELRHHGNGARPTALSDFAIEQIVVEVGPESIMRALDRLTRPELPIAAAE